MTELLLYTSAYFFFAVTAVLLCQKFGLGSVLGYLLAGICIGPVFGIVGKEAESIQHIAEFGVVMMLFLVGLELAPQMLWQMRHKLLGLGGLQVLLTLGVVAGIAMTLGYRWQIAVVVGCVLALSSTAIVLQTFSEKQLLGTAGGQAGFAVLLFQDVAAIPMLALLPLLAVGKAAEVETHGAGNLMANQAGWVVALVSVAAIVLILLLVRYVVPLVLRLIVKSKLHEIFMIFTLALVVGIAALMSLVGLSPALGAFIAGVALANSSYRHEMESHLHPFKSLFLGLFFITVGASMNFKLLGQQFFVIVGMTLGLLAVKALVLWCLGKLFRLPSLGGQLFALSLAQAGEFGFVLLSIANQHRLLPVELHDSVSLVVALSMVLTPLLFIFYDKVLSARAIRQENEERPHDTVDSENPVILLGYGQFGHQINNILISCGFHTTVIDNHAEVVDGLTKYGIKTYYGDATRHELLNTVGLHKAKLLIVCVGDDKQSRDIVKYARHNYPHLTIIARAHDSLHAYDLHYAGADYIVRETADAAQHAGCIVMHQLGLPQEQVIELSQFYEARERYQLDTLAELHNPEISIFANEELLNKAREIDMETKAMMQAIMRGDKVEWEENPNSWVKLKKGIS
ncbi:monovalent cation:proton antiporter-2 (CPA2) family protein [Alysiella crassa]|uniref:K(+)/H(+) antiporter n=1 Tax=Alysiella crassa TaxID=153491 RepID=A0A376BUF4_9NEIS|nr:monovalent cation:proton antiporter-2 (CPA2) family protein [Alysiella crassa]UOP07926.1 monovalent cation:proton antiporter-2 (CPA2) family protein [Alysiella crassa]SSY79984.1 K(+)/H(+) antiporter [Alysiella crassa]